jgi:ribosomal protein S18 acetylase RimI-like enzyme
MRDDEFASWLPRTRQAYAANIARTSRLSAEQALAKVGSETEALFPRGRPSAEQSVFVIEADGEPVGQLWVAERGDETGRYLWVYLVHVEEKHRGRGYGRAAMTLAEEEARRRGLDLVGLNVFSANTVARDLYQSLGYEEIDIQMRKQI